MLNSLLFNLFPAILLAFAAGMIGVFALMRRMSLAADAISHIALPGLGLAFLYKINPLIGGAATLLVGALLIWKIEGKTTIPTETIIGVIFSLSLALGSLITPQEDLIEALFGGIGSFSTVSFAITTLITLGIIFAILNLKNKFILQMISPDLASVTGLKSNRLNLYFLLLFALTVILGLRFLGTLLMGALIIIPAAVAKNWSWNISSMLIVSSIIGALSVIAGFAIGDYFNMNIGPTIIVFAGILFFASLFFKR